MTYKHQVECCICRDWRQEDKTFYTPTRQERLAYFLEDKKLSHTYCIECQVAHLKHEGFTTSELEKIIKELDEIEKNE